jgi:hypothetical protein
MSPYRKPWDSPDEAEYEARSIMSAWTPSFDGVLEMLEVLTVTFWFAPFWLPGALLAAYFTGLP